MTIEAKVARGVAWWSVAIIGVTEGYTQTLENGKWVNTTSQPQRFEEEIVTFGRCFESEATAQKFLQTKPFKAILKGIEKTWK